MGSRHTSLWALFPIALLLVTPVDAFAVDSTVLLPTANVTSPAQTPAAQAATLEFQFDRNTLIKRALEDLTLANDNAQLAAKLRFAAVRIAESNHCNHAGQYVIVHFESGREFQIYEQSSSNVWGDTGFLTADSMTDAVRLFRKGWLCE